MPDRTRKKERARASEKRGALAAPATPAGATHARLRSKKAPNESSSRRSTISASAALLAACERFANQGLAAFAEEFAARDALRDRTVTVQEAESWLGIARGVDAAGALQVQTADGDLRAVHAGDVSVRAAS